jgi:hypothetical protein
MSPSLAPRAERRHHRRVQRDRRLDTGHRGVEVSTIREIETFMTLLSSTITNWAAARMMIANQDATSNSLRVPPGPLDGWA